MSAINRIRIIITEFFAICLIILVSELIFDGFKKNEFINKEIFLNILNRAVRVALFIRLLLLGLEYIDNYRKKKNS